MTTILAVFGASALSFLVGRILQYAAQRRKDRTPPGKTSGAALVMAVLAGLFFLAGAPFTAPMLLLENYTTRRVVALHMREIQGAYRIGQADGAFREKTPVEQAGYETWRAGQMAELQFDDALLTGNGS